jgi:hypothetical protein
MKLLFDAYYYTDEAMALNKRDIVFDLDIKKHTYIKKVIIDIEMVESACESRTFNGGTSLTMFSGDAFVLKMLFDEYAKLTKVINSKHILCQMNN